MKAVFALFLLVSSSLYLPNAFPQEHIKGYLPEGAKARIGKGYVYDADDAVYLWDSQTGEAVHTFVSHALDVTDLVFSPDGKTLASSSYGGTVLLWDLTTLAPNR